MSPWVVDAGNIDQIGSGFWQAAEGVQSLDMNGTVPGGIHQDLATTPGATYNLSFSMAGNTAATPTIKHLQVFWNGGSIGTFTFDTTGHSFASMGWTTMSASGLVATGATTQLRFLSLDTGTNAGPALDNVVVVQATGPGATPEPGSVALLIGLGVSGSVFALRRRR